MSKSRMFIAAALSAALAFAAMPASAATDMSGNPDDASDNGVNSFQHQSGASGTAEAASSLNVFFNPEQIQATIPLEVTIIATGDPAIQGEIVAPTNYRIENNSTTNAIRVRTVCATDNDSKHWRLGRMTPSGDVNENDYGILDIDLKPTAAPDTAAVSLEDASSPQAVRGEAWSVGKRAAVDAEPARLELSLSGTSKITQGLFGSLGTKIMTNKVFTIAYTVGVHTPGDPLEGNGSGDTEKDGGFFLRVADNPVSATLRPYAKRAFDLQDIQEHSRALPAADESSALLRFYTALCTSMRPEGDYECWVRYDGEDWPVRIIGVNQDVVAQDGNGYARGALVGLTFQFRDLVGKSHPYTTRISSNSGGWGGEHMNLLRDSLNYVGGDLEHPGEFLAAMDDAVEDAIVPVRKYYGPNGTSDRVEDIVFTEDKMFLASFYELAGRQPTLHTVQPKPWVPFEGTGVDHNEQYLFYKGKNTSSDSDKNFAYMMKMQERDWAVSRADASGVSSSGMGEIWWTRSVAPGSTNSFWRVQAQGQFQTDGNVAYGVCPCFCL